MLGTLITPYCSGLGNLVFVVLLLRDGGDGADVVVNCLVNNATNLTLLLGLPALLWTLAVIPGKQSKPRSRKHRREAQLTRLSLLLTLVAAGFFLGVTWLLGRDGTLDSADGWTLVALFLFWQSYSVYEVLRDHVSEQKSLSPLLFLELALLLASAAGQFFSIEYLVGWIEGQGGDWLDARYLGWLTGWLMVVPNALLALYYARRNQPAVVYSSQLGDGHICIPFCIGLFAAFRPIEVPALLAPAALILGGAILVHAVFIVGLGRLPRWAGFGLLAAYGWFCFAGLT